MEWFWNIVDKLQKSAASATLQNFSANDWILLIAIFWGLIQGSRKGFSEMFGKLLGIFLVSMLVLSFYPVLVDSLGKNLPILPVKIAEVFSFFVLTVLFWLSVSWGINIFGKLFKVEAQGLLNVFGGMAFGVLRMMILFSLLAQFLLLLPVESIQKVFAPGRTYTGHTISQWVPDLHKIVTRPFSKPALKKSLETYKVGG